MFRKVLPIVLFVFISSFSIPSAFAADEPVARCVNCEHCNPCKCSDCKCDCKGGENCKCGDEKSGTCKPNPGGEPCKTCNKGKAAE